MTYTRRGILSSLIMALTLLVVGSQATQPEPPALWAYVDAHQSLRMQREPMRVAFSSDGTRLASIVANGVVVQDLASGNMRSAFADGGENLLGLAFSPSGRMVAAVSERGRVLLWDAETGFRKRVLFGHDSAITAMAFSPNDQEIATGGSDARLVVSDLGAGSAQRVLAGGTVAVTAIAFARDSRSVATATRDGAIRLWDTSTDELKGSVRADAASAVRGLTFSPDGLGLASVSENRIAIWDVSSGVSLRAMAQNSFAIYAVAFSPDGSVIASGDEKGRIELWNARTGQHARSLPTVFNTAINHLQFALGGQVLVGSGADRRLAVWNIEKGTLDQVLVGHTEAVEDTAFIDNDETLASVTRNGEVIFWDVATGRQLGSATQFVQQMARGPVANSTTGIARAPILGSPTVPPVQPGGSSAPDAIENSSGPRSAKPEVASQLSKGSATLSKASVKRPRPIARPQDRQGLTALAISPDGSAIGTAGADGKIRVWNGANVEPKLTFAGNSSVVASGVAFIGGGKKLASVARDSDVRLWDVATGAETALLHGHEHPIRTVVASPDGALIASGGEETRVMLWDAATGKLSGILMGNTEFVNTVAFSPDRKLVAAAGTDGRIQLWEASTGKLIRTLLGHAGEVNSIAFSPDGQLLASAGEDTRVLLWDVSLGQLIKVLDGHQTAVRTIAFSRDGGTLASAGEDTSILIWSVATRSLVKTLSGATGFVNSVVFSPSGNQLFSAGTDNQLTRWNLAAGKKDLVRPAN